MTIEALKIEFGFALQKAMSSPTLGKKKKIGNKELAIASGLSDQSISNYRSGISLPEPPHMRKIMSYLGDKGVSTSLLDSVSDTWSKARKGGGISSEESFTDWEQDFIYETRQLSENQKRQIQVLVSQMIKDNHDRANQQSSITYPTGKESDSGQLKAAETPAHYGPDPDQD